MKESTVDVIRGVLVLGPTLWFLVANLVATNAAPQPFLAAARQNQFLAILGLTLGGILPGLVIGFALWTVVWFVLKATGRDVNYIHLPSRRTKGGK